MICVKNMIRCGLGIMRCIAPLPLRFKLRLNIFNSWIVTLQRWNEQTRRGLRERASERERNWEISSKRTLSKNFASRYLWNVWYFFGSTYQVSYADKIKSDLKKNERNNTEHDERKNEKRIKAHTYRHVARSSLNRQLITGSNEKNGIRWIYVYIRKAKRNSCVQHD